MQKASCSIAFDDTHKKAIEIANRAMNAQNLTFIKTQSFVKSFHTFLVSPHHTQPKNTFRYRFLVLHIVRDQNLSQRTLYD